jgi:hypothetical protein
VLFWGADEALEVDIAAARPGYFLFCRASATCVHVAALCTALISGRRR